MQAALPIYLTIGGLLIDVLGAAFLAYDVLYGPEARFQAAIRHNRLAAARRNRDHRHAQLQRLLNTPDAPEKRVRWLRQRLRALTEASEESLAEFEHFQLHALRAQRIAVVGLLLLMVGFVFQGVASVLTMQPP